MYLKRLEIQGFKSFATRTVFEFGAGITAVIGPNGSGKCLHGDSRVALADGREVTIRELVDGALTAPGGNVEALDDGWLSRENPQAIRVLSLNPATLKFESRPVAAFVKRTAPEQLLRIRTRSGREVTATPYHPLFTLERGELRTLRADEVRAGVRLAVPRRLPSTGKTVSIDPHEVLAGFDDGDRVFVTHSDELRAWVQGARASVGTYKQWVTAAGVRPLQIKGLLDGQSINSAALVRLGAVAQPPPLSGQLKIRGDVPLRIPEVVSPAFARFLGLLIAEGRVTAQGDLRFVNSDPAISDDFASLAWSLFGIKAFRRHYKAAAEDTILFARAMGKVMERHFAIPFNSGSAQKVVPPPIFRCAPDVQWAFLSGLIEGDGHLHLHTSKSKGSRPQPYIEYATASHALARQMVSLFLRLGVVASLRSKQKYASTTVAQHRRMYYSVFVYGVEQLRHVARHLTFVGQKQHALQVLRELPSGSNPNLDVIPGVTPLVREAARAAGVSIKRHRKGRAKLAAYVEQRCEASRSGLLEVVGQIEELGAAVDVVRPLLDRLNDLATSDLYWDEIVSVESVEPPDPWVYDLSVEETHNFVAENIVVHNSNVSDAIRWVLGEQNPRVMRLRKSEDALFAGGQKRAPAGLAEVSLWLDNSEGWLPVAYDEVVVTRRLHRSGESEYLLNRSRVRLRDVADLFLRAKVGQNSYALMGQGMVDQVLSLRPEERRALLEEAAEVRHYQLRVEEARDRLAATEDNLEKVDLIIAEIAPRLGRLERAARRAEEHARLTGELAEALATWYAVQWREREDVLVAARAAYDQHNAEFAAAVARSDQLESRLAAVQDEATAAANAVSAAEARRGELAEQARAAAARQTLEAERLGFVRRRLGELEGESGQIERERADLAATLAPGGESADLVGMLAAARSALDEQLASLAAVERAAEAARRTLAEAEGGERRRAADLRESEDRLARLEREAAIAGRETPALLERQAQLLAHLKRIGHETLQQRRVAVLAAREVERADAARSVAVWNLEAARDAVAEANRATTDRRHAVEEQSRRFELLERMRDQFAQVDPGAVAVVEGAGAAGYRVLGVLGTLLRVSKGMEAAIEAALAENLNAVVLPGGRDALAALALLAERATGRATLLPLDAIRPVAPINLAREKGVVGVAARFVRCEAQYRELLDTLLGRVVIVDDLATAREMLRRGFGQIVTVDGVVLRPSGAITGGRHAAEGGRFALERDLETIPGEIERLLAEGEAAEGELVRLRGDVSQQERVQAEANAEVRRAEQRYAQAHTRMLAGRGHLAPIRGELVYVRGALAKLTERRETLAGEQIALAERRAALAAALAEARDRAATARQAAREPGARVDAFRAQVAEARGALAALEREQTTLAGLRASRQAVLHRLDERLTGRRREAEARRAEIAQADADAERLAVERARLDTSRDAATAALLPARARLARLNAALAELDGQLREGRAALAGAERRALAAENDLHRRAGELDRLRDEMAGDGFAPNDELGMMNDELMTMRERGTEDGELEPANAPNESGGVRPLAIHRSSFIVHPPDAAALGELVRSLRAKVRQLGSVDEVAPVEYAEARERHEFLSAQVADLREAETGLQEAIAGLRGTIREQFRATFIRVNEDFGKYFALFFGGGSAKLVLTEPEDYGESGVDIVARPPGKRLQSLTLLSGGERAMTAVALLFALLEANPAPFCVLDEVDAALDEANVGRFGDALRELARRTQFAVITHNRGTIQAADTIYGVSMGTDGVSTVLSLRLGDVPE